MIYEIHIPEKALVLPISNARVALSAALCHLQLDRCTDLPTRRRLLEELQRDGTVALEKDQQRISIIRCD